MSDHLYEDYLHDLGIEIKELALEAKKTKEKSMGTENESYYTGYLMGFHRIVSLMIQQAEGFDIPLDKIALSDIDPDKSLV